MRFVLVCRDGKDRYALSRRLAAREKHLEALRQNNNFVFGTAIIENNAMVGSVMIMDFEDEAQLENYLKSEIYVLQNVWQKIDKISCAPGFLGPVPF